MKRAVLAILGLCSIASVAEAKVRFVGKADLMVSTSYIVNRADQQVRIDLSDNGKDWTRYALAAKDGDSIYSDRDSGVERLYIRLVTGKRQVKGNLEFGHRYQVYWNADRNLWDVAELDAR